MSMKGNKHTKETKDKISKANSGVNSSHYGKKFSEETRRRMVLAQEARRKRERKNDWIKNQRWKVRGKASPEEILKLFHSRDYDLYIVENQHGIAIACSSMLNEAELIATAPEMYTKLRKE